MRVPRLRATLDVFTMPPRDEMMPTPGSSAAQEDKPIREINLK
jgi:hypothetical protein